MRSCHYGNTVRALHVQESEEPVQSITDKLARMDVMTEKRSVLTSMHELLSNCQPLLQRPDFPINGIVALLMDLVRSAVTTSCNSTLMMLSANEVSCCPPVCKVCILKWLLCQQAVPEASTGVAGPAALQGHRAGGSAEAAQRPSGGNSAAGENDAAGGGDQLHAAPRKRAGGAATAKPVCRAQLGLWQGERRAAAPCCGRRHAYLPIARSLHPCFKRDLDSILPHHEAL